MPRSRRENSGVDRLKSNKIGTASILMQFKDRKDIIFKVASHNINGNKNSNRHKLEMLRKWMETRDYVVIGLVKTNILAKKNYFLTKNFKNYKEFWSSRDVNKKKGSEVGLLIRKD